jgi:RND family efflux transporter MFP subunit
LKRFHAFAAFSFLFFTCFPHLPAAAREGFPVIFEATHRAVLPAERAGTLVQLGVDVGDYVKKGATVARVDTSELALVKKRNQQTVSHLNNQVQDLSRLIQKGLATNNELSQVTLERDTAQAELKLVQHQINKSYIRAPFSCIVVKRLVQPHEWVSAGEPVVEIVNPWTLRAVGNIPTHLAVQLNKGDKHVFTVHDLNVTVEGTVNAVSPIVDERSNTARVYWNVSTGEKSKLSPGMKGEVRVGP